MNILKLFFIAIIILVIGVFIYMNTAFKDIAEDYGSAMTGTKVEITAVTINPFANTVSLQGFNIGNPAGFKGENAIEFGSIYSRINLLSLFSSKILINEVKLDGANIYYEVGATGDNIRQILANIKSYRGTPKEAAPEATSASDRNYRDILIKDLHVTNSKVVLAANLFGFEENKEVKIDDIHLIDINSSSGKLVARQVGEQILAEVTTAVMRERASKYIDKLGGDGQKVMEGLKGLF